MPLVLILSAWCLGVSQTLPALPDLPLDTFPPAAREMLGRAQRAAAERPKNAEAAIALGRALQAWEQWESAHQAYERAAALAPDAFAPRYLDAVVLQRLARHREAAARLKEALAIDAAYLPARLRLAEALYESGDLAAAAPLFAALVAEAAAEPAARVGLGRIAAREGRHQAAIEHFERAIELFPELGAAHYGLARGYRAAGRAADAARALAAHQAFGPRWPALPDPILSAVTGLRDDPRALLARGVASAKDGDLQAGIAAHEAALAADPSLVQAHANLLTLYGRAQNWPRAEAHYRRALDAGIATAELHYDYGVVLGMQERWDEAEAAYRRALELNPLHVQAHNNLGQIFERRRDLAAATAQYAKAVEIQPSLRIARFNLGRMLMAANRLPEAIGQFEKLQAPRDAEAPLYLFALATARIRAGQTPEGVRLADEARQLALEHGQADLAATIARELAKLKQ